MENRTPPESRQAQAAAAAPQTGEGRPRTEAAAPLRHRLACMLFVAGDPVPVSELARVLALPAKRVRELLRENDEKSGLFGLLRPDGNLVLAHAASHEQVREQDRLVYVKVID